MTTKGFFSNDRQSKYGYGVVRLGILVVASLVVFPKLHTWEQYWASNRWIGHAYIGTIGAYVNVEQGGLYVNVLLLLGAAISCYWDVYTSGDYCCAVYLMKTFGGDFLAGKLDTTEWKLVLFFTFGVFVPTLWYFNPDYIATYTTEYGRIFMSLFIVQVFCEYGDAHCERWTFFRHRFSYEVTNIALLVLLPNMTAVELMCIQIDLFICFFYRLSNFVIIILATDMLSKGGIKILFSMMGFATNQRIQHVSCPMLASTVMKQFSDKGKGLESYISCPSWLPVISLESIDGEQWQDMRRDFDVLLKNCPSVSVLQRITQGKTKQLVASGQVVDANAIARLTIEVFVAYLFGEDNVWGEEVYETLVTASWEWRKEISVRGKGDKRAKQAAVDVLVNELLPSAPLLWNLFGDKWKDSRYYSLILQPFIISPCINTGDVMCAVAMCPEGSTLDQCLRAYHPFPIFERYADKDVFDSNGSSSSKDSNQTDDRTNTSQPNPPTPLVPAHTHVLMFTSDFRNSDYPWPVFGAGPRSCAGAHLATPFLKILHQEFVALAANDSRLFQPLRGHKYSGRHLDGKVGAEGWLQGPWYFARTICSALYRATVEAQTGTSKR
jgi:hypothetical protein